MCVPHGASVGISNGYVQKGKPKKSIKRVSQSQFEKGDPDFVDERIKTNKAKNEKSFLESLFS